MNISTNKMRKRITIALAIVVVIISCYIFFNQISSIATVTLEVINDSSLVVLRPDQGYLTIKTPEVIGTLLEKGREYIITYDTYPLLGSHLISIELSP